MTVFFITSETIEDLISSHFECELIKVESLDNVHYNVLVVSKIFEGKNSVSRHKLVYSALGKYMGNEIHAMSIRTLTLSEFALLP